MKEISDTLHRYKGMRLSVSVLEQDVAYFDARLALLEGEPDSYYQYAQIEIYGALKGALGDMLQKLHGGEAVEEGVMVSEIVCAD